MISAAVGLSISAIVLPQGDQRGDRAGVQVPLCTEKSHDEAAVADLVTGLLK